MGFVTGVIVNAIREALQEGDPMKIADSALHILKEKDLERLSQVALRMILGHIAEERAPTGTLGKDEWMRIGYRLSKVQTEYIQRLTPEGISSGFIREEARSLTLRLVTREARAQEQLRACFVALLVSYRAMR